MDSKLERQEPDEARPAKRVRLDAPLHVTEDVQEEIVDDDEGWDDIYADSDPVAAQRPSLAEEAINGALATSRQDDAELEEANTQDPTPSPREGVQQAPPAEHAQSNGADEEPAEEKEVDDGVPAEAIDDGDELMEERHTTNAADEPSVRILEEVSGVNGNLDVNLKVEDVAGQTDTTGEMVQPVTNLQETEDGNDVIPVESKAQIEQSWTSGEAEEPTNEVAEDASAGLLDALGAPDGDFKPSVLDGEVASQTAKPTDDPEFMAAAAEQKDNAVAEWQFDPSDAESSDSDSDSDDSSSDSDSDSDSEGGYEMLDPATAAKILMSGEGDDDGAEGKPSKAGADHQPRTANEVKEDVVPKPDVVITDDTKITELGHVEGVVENMILIKGATPGEYQVLESGSVLCNADHQVIGAVAETLGRVQEPMYSVAFTNAQEIEDAGLAHGAEVFYVDSHSTFVFTQPLKNLRGTDASNIHDEEVAEEEMEFSDDEAEAEYKRQKKMAKKAARGGFDGAVAPARGGGRGGGGGRTFGAPGHDSGQTFVGNGYGDAPQQSYGGGLSYDDEPATEEFYSPLKRPENLSQMMAGGGGPPKAQQFDRGRGRGGRGGDRGRGDRGGRGRGDRGGRGRGGGGFNNDRGAQRGGRGGAGYGGQQATGGHRGNAQSFPDRHNNDRVNGGGGQHSLPPKPRVPQGASPPPPPPPPPSAQQQQQYPQAYNSYPPQPQQQQQAAQQTYTFNGYTFQYGGAPPGSASQTQQQQPTYAAYQPPAASPGAAMPGGAYVNPAFYQNQQGQGQGQWGAQQPQPQWPQQQQQQQGYGGWNGQPYAQAGAAAAQPYAGAGSTTTQQQQQQQQNLAEILRRMGGGGQ